MRQGLVSPAQNVVGAKCLPAIFIIMHVSRVELNNFAGPALTPVKASMLYFRFCYLLTVVLYEEKGRHQWEPMGYEDMKTHTG